MLSRISLLLVLIAVVLLLASALPWLNQQSPVSATVGMVDMAAPSAADIAYGRQLFQAKGCASCHQHGAVAGSGQFSGGPGGAAPVLTAYPGDPAYLRAWLHDPKALKPATTMPNLGLSDAEITALIAFLKSAPPVSH